MTLSIEVTADVVCPWCFIGKRRLEKAIALKPEIPVELRFRPYFLNPWVPPEGIGRNAEELLRKVKAAQYVASHPGEVCPAKWQEGEKTLAPSLDLVGKI